LGPNNLLGQLLDLQLGLLVGGLVFEKFGPVLVEVVVAVGEDLRGEFGKEQLQLEG
jgi:hypothetical protein